MGISQWGDATGGMNYRNYRDYLAEVPGVTVSHRAEISYITVIRRACFKVAWATPHPRDRQPITGASGQR